MKRNREQLVILAGGVALAIFLSGQPIAADSSKGGYSVWSQVSHSQATDNNIVPLYGRTHYVGEINAISLGFDRRLNSRLLAGLSLTRTNVNLDTPWNWGTYDSTTSAIAPYAAYLLNDTFTVSGSAGYAWSNVDLMSSAAAVPPGKASYDADRAYFTVNLKANRWYDKLNLSGHIGYAYSSEDADSYLWSNRTVPVPSSTTDFGQVDVGVRAAYRVGKLLPYVALSYGNDSDVTRSVSVPNRDQDGMVYTIGVNLYGNGAVSGGFYYRTVDRENIDDDTLAANLTMRF